MSDRAKHTPGPWHVSAAGRSVFAEPNKIDHRGVTYAPCITEGIRPVSEEGNANACLIAAAPEMLAALELIAGLMQSLRESNGWQEIGYWCGPRVHRAEDAARAAIAKAEGGAA